MIQSNHRCKGSIVTLIKRSILSSDMESLSLSYISYHIIGCDSSVFFCFVFTSLVLSTLPRDVEISVVFELQDQCGCTVVLVPMDITASKAGPPGVVHWFRKELLIGRMHSRNCLSLKNTLCILLAQKGSLQDHFGQGCANSIIFAVYNFWILVAALLLTVLLL